MSKERLLSLWELDQDEKHPVRVMLGNDRETYDSALAKLVAGLARDRDTGRVILASSQRLRARSKSPGTPAGRSRADVSNSPAPFHRRFDGPESVFCGKREVHVVTQCGMLSARAEDVPPSLDARRGSTAL